MYEKSLGIYEYYQHRFLLQRSLEKGAKTRDGFMWLKTKCTEKDIQQCKLEDFAILKKDGNWEEKKISINFSQNDNPI